MVIEARAKEVLRNEKRGRVGKAYPRPEKYPANTRCPKCQLVFQDGVWKRGGPENRQQLHYQLCPACLQVRDRQVGGVIQFGGSFIAGHRQDLLNRIRNLERRALLERPLERIIDIKEARNKILVSATTEHLIARLGKAVLRDFGGTLDLRYAPEDKYATARWHRDV
ncbi:MAG TPA: BCAM0308 family protein [Acidobacteriota bacterium]|nr:BCAM0308 family protein [Acidobacteriota bacterium]